MGGEPFPLTVSKPVSFESYSTVSWGLLSDLPDRKEPTHDCLFPNPGIATDGRVDVNRMISVDTEEREAREILFFARSGFNQLEENSIAVIYRQFGLKEGARPIEGLSVPGRLERADARIKITKLVRSETRCQGRFIYYFEASKEYRPQDCGPLSLFWGWIAKNDKETLNFIEKYCIVTDCDAKGAGFSHPMGVLRIQGREFMVVQSHGWEDESYSIFELTRSGIQRALSVSGGGC